MRAIAAPLALLVLAGALSLGAAQEPAEEPPAADLVNPNPLSTLTLEGLEATRSLPLFTPSRTAPVVEAPVVEEEVAEAPVEAPVDPEQPPPALELIGIVLTDSTQTALLRNTSTSEVLRLASGDEYESWMLKIVDARSIELRNGDRVEALKMFESFPARAPSEPFGDGMQPMDPTMQQIPGDGQGFDDPTAIPTQEPPVQEAEPPMPEEQIPPPEGFAPQPGDAPIPEEGAPAPEGNNGANL